MESSERSITVFFESLSLLIFLSNLWMKLVCDEGPVFGPCGPSHLFDPVVGRLCGGKIRSATCTAIYNFGVALCGGDGDFDALCAVYAP